MLDFNEKNKIRDVLKEVLIDLNVNSNINMAYFLNSIDNTNKKINELESRLQMIQQNQVIINQKLDMIMRKIS